MVLRSMEVNIAGVIDPINGTISSVLVLLLGFMLLLVPVKILFPEIRAKHDKKRNQFKPARHHIGDKNNLR